MKRFTILTMMIFLSAIYLNGFSQELPDDWTGDSGIDTYQESTIVHNGSYSCRVDVNTGSQASCDMRSEDISVSAGDSYTYSFYIQTSDHVKARVALQWVGASPTYGSYSPISTSGFTQVTYTGTVPTGATDVKVGIRFYDQSGFSAPETQYVDDFTFESPTGTPLVVPNGDMESWPSGVTAIEKAYSISGTEMDVVYDYDVSSVDPADYTLTGTAAITFTGATIDGTDAKVVHLSGASSSMNGDATLDNIADAALVLNFDLYAGIMPISFNNTNNPGGPILNGYIATYQGIISANDAYNNVWISDAAGAYNGVMIYDDSFDGLVAVGDEILMIAERVVFNSLTELVNPEEINTISTGNSPYGPDVIDGSDIDESLAADTNPGESWEGQLVQINNFTVDSYINYDYRCSWSDGFTTYYFHIGDNVDYHLNNITLNVGQTYQSVTGVVDWYDSNSDYRINPREQSDIVALPGLDANFVADQTSVMPGTTVNFTDITTGGVTPYSYEWDLDGDGAFDDAFIANPSYLYSTSGTYDISLRVTDSDTPASVDTEIKLAYITVADIPNLIISEVTDPGDVWQSKFVEIYNLGTSPVDLDALDIYLVRQANGSGLADIELTGSIAPDETYSIAYNSTEFNNQYGFPPNQSSGNVSGNGDDGYFLYLGGGNTTGTLFDSYGELGVDGTGEDWEYTNSHAVRHRDILVANSTWTASEWTIMSADVDDMTPKAHRETRAWQGTASSEWRSKGTNWDGNGYIPDASDNVDIPDVSKAPFPIISGAATCNSLYIASSAKVEIASSGSLTVIGAINNNADTTGLVLKADVSGYASLLHNTNGVDATVESYISGNVWHGISSPMSDAKSRVFLGSYLTYFNETDSTWSWIEAVDHSLGIGEGFFAWATSNTTVSYYGNLNNGDANPPITYSSGAGYTVIGWNLIGNPFPSAVEWTANWGQTAGKVDATMYVYDAANGHYDTWNYNTGGTNEKTNGDIAVGQGIWVKTNAASPSITVPQSERKHSTEPFYKDEIVVDGRVSFNVEGEGYSDEMVIYFRDDATNEFDSEFDAWKLFGMVETPQLYSITGNNKLAVNTLPYNNNVIPAGLVVKSNGIYTISVNDLENLGDEVTVYLEDLMENKMINLNDAESYSFTSSISDDPNRFLLHFGNTLGNNELLNTNDVNIYAYGDNVYFNSGELLSGDIVLYDLAGKQILSKSISNTSFEKINVSSLSGYYLVNFISENVVVNQKVFIK